MPTTITIEPKVRDRLKTFGHAGQTYNEILTRMMDHMNREQFLRDLRETIAQTTDWADIDELDWK